MKTKCGIVPVCRVGIVGLELLSWRCATVMFSRRRVTYVQLVRDETLGFVACFVCLEDQSTHFISYIFCAVLRACALASACSFFTGPCFSWYHRSPSFFLFSTCNLVGCVEGKHVGRKMPYFSRVYSQTVQYSSSITITITTSNKLHLIYSAVCTRRFYLVRLYVEKHA